LRLVFLGGFSRVWPSGEKEKKPQFQPGRRILVVGRRSSGPLRKSSKKKTRGLGPAPALRIREVAGPITPGFRRRGDVEPGVGFFWLSARGLVRGGEDRARFQLDGGGGGERWGFPFFSPIFRAKLPKARPELGSRKKSLHGPPVGFLWGKKARRKKRGVDPARAFCGIFGLGNWAANSGV